MWCGLQGVEVQALGLDAALVLCSCDKGTYACRAITAGKRGALGLEIFEVPSNH